MEEVIEQAPRSEVDQGSETMRAPDEVPAMLALQALGWGVRRIAAELGCSRNTVRELPAPGRLAALSGAAAGQARWTALQEWLAERFRRHRGNADVVRQELRARARASRSACARSSARSRRCGGSWRPRRVATVRFETPPGQQLQIDFGERRVRDRRRGASGASCSSPRWATRAGCYVARVPARAAVGLASTGWRAPSGTSAACRDEVLLDNARALVDAPRRADPRGARSTTASTPSAATGASGRGPARRTGRAPRARTSAASATSSATPSPGTASRAGRRWRRISRAGCARWPTCASTARPASRRSRASSATRRAALKPLGGRPPFRQVRELTRRGADRLPASSSTPTATACRGG